MSISRVTLVALCCVGSVTLGACRFEDRYLLDRTSVDALRQLSWKNRRRVAVPAVRVRDEAIGHLRGDSVQLGIPLPEVAAVEGSQPVEVRAGGVSVLATSGWLTGALGVALGVGGAVLLDDERSRGSDLGAGIGVLVVGVAAALTGVILGIEGVRRPPQEVREGEAGVLFLDRFGESPGASANHQ